MNIIAKIYNLQSEEFYKNRARQIFEKAIILIVEKKYEESLKELMVAQKLDRENPEYTYFCGVSLFYMNDPKAITYFEKSTQLEPNNPIYMLWYGISLYTIKKYEEAKEILEKAIRLDSENEDIKLYLTRTLNKLKEFDEAIFSLRDQTDDVEALYELGTAHLGNDEFEKSIEIYKKIISLDVYHSSSYYALSRVYCKLERYQEAKDILNVLMKRMPDETLMIKKQIKAIEFLESF